MRTALSGLTVATIRGVQLKLHFSLIFLLLYVVFIASAQFPFVVAQSGIGPESIYSNPIVWGLIFALGLFFSVVLHEFGHVTVAQSMGVKVSSVTLMMLGGVSEMEKIPEKPYAEFKVSIIGPVVSFALAGVFFALSQDAVRFPNLMFFGYWLSRANFILAVFNLLPAFPMDGGRVLRSLLAVKQGMARATHTTVSVAHGLAWALGIFGFLQFNFILMLIAFFIYSAASNELMLSESKNVLRGVKVGDVGLRIPAVYDTESLRQVATKMFQFRTRVLPVMTQGGRPTLVAIDQLRQVPNDRWSQTTVAEIMNTVPHVLSASTTLEEVLPEIAAMGVLPFQEDGHVVGVVRYQDLADLIDFKTLDESFSVDTEEPKRPAA